MGEHFLDGSGCGVWGLDIDTVNRAGLGKTLWSPRTTKEQVSA